MQPNESPTKPAIKSALPRYILALVALVLIVGGLAWVAQYLPSSKPDINPKPAAFVANKSLVDFTHPAIEFKGGRGVRAVWKKAAEPAKNKEEDQPPQPDDKDVETGSKGHYDFPFKNVLGQDLEVVGFASTCDCTSVKVCVLPTAEWERLVKIQEDKPGDDLPYASEPTWHELVNDKSGEKKPVLVKADERGIVRVEWSAKKAAGQLLNLNPTVKFQSASDPTVRAMVPLVVPVKMSQPVQFTSPRIYVPTLIAGKAVKKFEAWSSTRPKLELSMTPTPADPHFVFEVKEYDQEKCAALEKYLIANKLGSRVLCGYEITLTVYENKDGRQLDQGTYYRKWPVTLDGRLEQEIFGPEIVGRNVKPGITIGGDDDRGKVRFKSFEAKIGSSKDVILTVDAGVKLETFKHEPSWIEVKLTPPAEKKITGQVQWTLSVNVPPNTTGVRSFEESDAVTLKIAGTPERYLRIPLEGHISGQ